MHKYGSKIIFILPLFILSCLSTFTATASHSMGADLTYECLGGNSYKIRLAFYRDCIGVAEPANAIVNISSNSCGENFDIICYKIPGTGQEITPLCPSATSTCNGGIHTGIEEWIYEGTVVLPQQCTDWVFSFTHCCRNTAISTINDPGNNDFHVFSTLNNTIAPCNNSPTFSNKPVPFVCLGQQFCFNHGAYDADGDSLVYSLITPLQSATLPVTYFAPYSATQPVNSSPPMTFSSTNGNICMTPQSLEVTVMAVLVQEFRNGVLVGSVERDIQVTIINCTNNIPTLSGINGTSDITATICANNQFCFNVTSNDVDAGQNVSITYDQSIPGATFSTNSAQLPTGTFCWTPTSAEISSTPYCFTISVTDNACPYIGSQVYSFCLTVTGVIADAGPDQNLVCNTSTTISANGSGGTPPYSFLWSNGSSAQSVTVGPGTYTLTVSDGLCTMEDVVVISNAPLPTITATPVVDVSCNGGNDGSVTINVSSGTGLIEYSIDNGTTFQAGNVFSGLPIGTYDIMIRDANGCTATAQAVINEPALLVVIPSSVTATCTNNNGSISLAANGGTGIIEYSIDNGLTYQSSDVFNGLATGNYNVVVQDANGCTATSNINVPDEPPPTIVATPVVDVLCNTGNDGSITVTPNGGTGTIQYSIDNGVTYQAANIFSGLTTGNYTITIQDANGCTATAQAFIAEPAPLVVNPSSITSTCTNSNGSVTIVANGGTGIIEYSIDNGVTYQSSDVFNGLATGNYDVVVQDANGCTATSVINVPDQPSPTIDATPVVDVTCNSGSNGSISVTPNGGTGVIQYSIDNGVTYQASNSFSGLTAGNYTITIQDANGCTATAQAVIAEPTPLVVNPTADNSTCTNSNGSVSIAANGGTGTIEYSIDNGTTYQSSDVFTGLATGNYNVVVQDANGCTASSIINVPDEPSPTIDATPVVDVLCYAGSDGSVSVTPNGGTGVIQYSIDNGVTYQASNTFSGLTAGNYTVTIQDGNGCTATAQAVIAEPTPLVVNPSSINSTCTNSNGSVSISANGGTGTFEYSIDNGVTYQPSNVFNGLATGNYDVVVRDGNGCTASSIINVPDEPSPTIDATPVVDVSCNAGSDGTISVTPNGGTGVIQYSIDNGVTYQASSSFSGLTAGNYTITIQDENGCTATAQAVIAEPTPLSVNPTAVNSTCTNSNGSVSIVASGGTGTIEYSIDNGVTYQSSDVFNGLATGNYDVVIQDANGCTTSTIVNVPDEPSPTIDATPVVDVSCNAGDDGSISVNPVGGTGVIEFSIDNGVTYQSANIFSGLTAGNYIITIQDENGCTATANTTISEPTPVVLNATTIDATCNGSNGSVNVNGNGGTGTIEFSIDGGINFQSSNDFSGLVAGNYNIIGQDANGCQGTVIASVSNALAPEVSSVQHVDVSCFAGNDGSITVNAIGGTGALEFSIDNGTSFQSGNIFSNLPAGVYDIVVRDANGCLSTAGITITQPAQLTFNTQTETETCESDNGAISFSASGGTGTITYSIDNGTTFQTSEVFNGLNAGNYDVVVMDANGCTSVSTSVVPDAPSPTITSTPVTNATCNGAEDGSVTINSNGGSGNILYSIDNGVTFQQGNSFTNLPSGNYQIQIQDTNGCVANTLAVITQPDAIVLNASTVDATCNGSNGAITMNGNGGTGVLEYSIDGGLSFQLPVTFNGLPAGNYNIIVQDANGCQDSLIAVVNNALAPVISSSPVLNVSCNAGSDGTITINASGGVGMLQYSIDNGTTYHASNTFTNLAAGLYDILVVDANGCITSATATIAEPVALSYNSTPVTETCSNGNGSITVIAAGGTGTLQYSIDGGTTFQNSEYFDNLVSSNYNIVIIDANGCTISGNVMVPDAPSPQITSANATNLTCFGSNNGTINITATGGSGALLYSINGGVSFQSTPGFQNLPVGNFNVVVQDTNNCTAITSLAIIQPPAVTFSSTTVQAICGNSNGALTIIASGGNGVFQFSIDSGITFTVGNQFNGLTAANYNVIIQDGAGCTASAIVAVSNAQSPVINAVTESNASCFGITDGSITVNASGGAGVLQYSINNGVTYQQSNSFTGLPAGNYGILVIDTNDCIVSSNAVIAQPPQITYTILPYEASCGNNDGSVTINAAGGTGTLEFSIDSTGIFQTGNSFLNLGAGNYNIIIQDATGCQVVGIASVNNLNGPEITNTLSSDLTCFGSNDGSIVINVNGGTGILNYSIDNGATFQTTNSFSNLPGGTYAVMVLDGNNCIATEGVLINEPTPVSFNILITDVTCGNANGVIDIYANGGTGSLQYSNDSGQTYISSTLFDNLLPGNYTIIVQDANNCSASALVAVNNLVSPAISSLNLVNVNCNGGNDGSAGLVLAGGAAPFVYQWSNGGTAQNINNLAAGNYSVLVTDADLCTATQSFVITEPPVLFATSSALAVSCFGSNDGSISTAVTGGTLPYNYLWSTGGTGSSENNLVAGNYSVIVTDSNGCSLSLTDAVLTPDELSISSSITPVNCNGAGNGSVSTVVLGGTFPYSYLWSNSGVTATISGISGGNYTLTVTDANNCLLNLSASVFEPPPLSLGTAGNTTICINQQSVISASATGGTAPYSYLWNNGSTSTSQIVSPVTSTTYTISVTDANGCTVTPQNINVLVNAPLLALASNDNEICDGESSTISVVVSGGDGGPYNYSWDNNAGIQNSVVVSPSVTTTYTVTVSDNCGTPAVSDMVTVIVHELPVVNFTPLPPSGCVPLQVMFDNYSVTTNGSQYYWTFGNGFIDTLSSNPVHTYYEPGSYDVSLTVTSAFGCVNTLMQPDAVIVHDLPVADFTPDNPVTTILNPMIYFTDLSWDAVDWQWEFGDGYGTSTEQHPRYEYQDTGIYKIALYISNQFGCRDTAYETVIVEGDFTIYIPNAFTPNSDGTNDYFSPQGIGIDKMEMLIFDRWGQKVFSSNSMDKKWDGTHMNDNSLCTQDVYIYVIRATDLFDKGHEYTGRVSLLR